MKVSRIYFSLPSYSEGGATGASRLCRKYCAVPPELDFVPLLLPGTDVPSFPVSPLRGWSNSAAHFFAGLGVATQTRLARPWAAGGRAGIPGSPPANAVTI